MSTSQPDLRLVSKEPAMVEEEAVDPNIGQVLDGRYMIERTLGKGGMGLVYAAKHVILQKPLAVKVLKEEVSRDEQVMARFRREAQSASAIGSPHICDVNDFGTLPDGSTYLVMEFLDGPALSSVLETDVPIPIPRILDIVMQLCDALGAAHDRGIVHRDLKPDNVHLVEQGGRKDFVKVLDFGIAKVGGAAGKKLTQAGQVFGTPHYMSPEQCGGREVDQRTDIYALGVILYEMTCGVVPFDADNLMGVLTKHVYENPIPPREFPPPVDVTPGLEAVILKSLAKQATDRYQSMADFRADLESVVSGSTPGAVMNGLGTSSVAGTQIMGSEVASLIGALPATPSLLEEPKSKTPVVLMVLAVLSVVVLGAAAFGAAFYFGVSPDEDVEVAAAGSPDDGSDPSTDSTSDTASADEGTAGTGADVAGENTESGDTVSADTESADTESADTESADTESADTADTEPVAALMITLASEPAGAEVYGDDDALLGNTPFELEQPAEGAEPVNVTLRMAGYRDRSIPVSHASATELTIRLDRRRGSTRRRQAPTTRPIQPRIHQMGGSSSPPPRPPPRPPSGGSGEIINPW